MKKSNETGNPLVDALADTRKSPIASNKLTDLPIMEDGMTADELAVQAGRSLETIRQRLKGMLDEGKLIVGRKQTTDLIGRRGWSPCYKMVEPK